MHSCDSPDLSAEPLATERLTSEQKERLTDVLDRYLSALEGGIPPPREELFAAHPDLAGTLRTYLDSLEQLHEVAAGFACPAVRTEAEAGAADDRQQRLGDFRLLREVGRGGMGVVYEARQISLDRRVALKVLPFAAVLDSRQIARFKHEAQAAAQLDHPNIVSVFAVGVERGVHYYAMQFIDGQSLDRALDELRTGKGIAVASGKGTVPVSSNENRDSPQRAPASGADRRASAGEAPTIDFCPSTCRSFLTARSVTRQEYFRSVARLGVQAADALHAAHEHGVVHRDIKPSNLLLDSDGKLWVTDFGLARCQTDAALTRTGDLVGTLRYMSPEQATGRSALVDQRTDVYSLGVTLYELLALQPAFVGDDGPALLRQIELQEPRPLRHWQPKIPADLETVVLKAMSKRREERYTTAREFADDLTRVLEGKPTVARPPTMVERLGKWARRHTRMVATAAAVCLLAVVGMAASMLLITREKIKTEQNYTLAQKHFREAQEAVDCLGTRLAERLADVPGAESVRRDLLQETLRYYRGFVDQAKENRVLRADLALTYNKIGTLTAEIGSTDEAVEAQQSAARLFEQLAADNPREPDYRRRLAVSQNNLALVLSRSGRTEPARRAYDDAIRVQEELSAASPECQQYLDDLALSYNNLGLLQDETGDPSHAEGSFREAIRLQQRLLDLGPDDPEHLRKLAASLNNLGALRVNVRPQQAAELYQRALLCQSKAAELRPDELKYKSDVALTYNNRGGVQSRQRQFAEAAASYARAIEIQDELARAAPAQKSYRHDLAVSYNNLGLAQSNLRQTSAAERSFRQALELQDALVRQNPRDLDLQSSLGGMNNNLGFVLEELARTEEAAKSYQQAIEHQQAASAQAPQVMRYRVFLSNHYSNYGRLLRRLGRADEAARAALARRDLWPKDPQHLFAVAEELALATKALGTSARADMTADQCAKLAIETLRQASAAGWKPAENPHWTESFAALKDQPGFARLVRQ
ncbi:MAG: serine/threonine-protein kinase [Thermoguttaceae bacterium]